MNLLQLEEGERIQSIIPIDQVADDDNLFLVTRRGYIKKTKMGEYKNIRKNGLIAMGLREGDTMIGGIQCGDDDDLIFVTKKGMSLRFKGGELREQGRTAMGVIGIRLDEDDEVVSFVKAEEGKTLAVISEYGYGKRTAMEEYKVQNRGGKGLITYRIKEKTGQLVSAKVLNDGDEIMMISEDGAIIRLKAESISILGRATSGVKLMNIKDSHIVAVAEYVGEE